MTTLATRFDPYTVSISIGGRRYEIWIGDETAQSWYAHDRSGADHPYPAEIELLRSKGRLAPGALVFDLGAHQSVIALFLAQIAGDTGRVLSVEASPRNIEAGRRNRELNRMENLELLQAAVADRPGSVSFVALDNGHIANDGEKDQVIDVEGTTIDRLAREWGTPDVLFLDIEGFEVRALRAGRRVLSTRPDVFVEVHVGCGLETAGGSVDKVLWYLPPHRFDRYVAVPHEGQEGTFCDLDVKALPASRFYIVAIGKRSGSVPWWLQDVVGSLAMPWRFVGAWCRRHVRRLVPARTQDHRDGATGR